MERYRIHPEAGVYFLTYSVVEWLPIFVSEAACKIVTESLAFCHRMKHLRINAFVVMPTHLHLIAFDAEFNAARLAATLKDFRKFTGRQLADYCSKHFPPCFSEVLREDAPGDRERRLWQPSRHPVAVLEEPFWQQKIGYLHDNPRRKGLVHRPEYWRFSSAAWYLANGLAHSDVPISPIEW
jgi:putative transposase